MDQAINKFQFTKEKVKVAIQALILLAASVAISAAIAKDKMVLGGILMALAFGLPLFVVILINFRWGLMITVVYAFFLFTINRLLPVVLPLGILFDLLLVISLLGFLISQRSEKLDWQSLRNPVAVFYFLFTFYNILQALNPNSLSIVPWLVTTRSTLLIAGVLIMFYQAFGNIETIKLFTKIWLGLALFTALYGIFQEVFGYRDFEWRWIYEKPGREGLIFISGKWRRFSILSDVGTFGVFMAYSGVFCAIMALGEVNSKHRLVLGLSALTMFVSMLFSGTRTAFAIIPIGFIFYALVTFYKPQTVLFGIAFLFGMVVILYGPFDHQHIRRVRSLMRGGDDPSLNVRDYKRTMMQPYIHSHPIGGGVKTTGTEGHRYSPGHYLDQGWDPDSGYLRTALEIGWIGLILRLALYTSVVVMGIVNFFRMKNPFYKTILAAYFVAFFAVSIAGYSQSPMRQKPLILMLLATMVFVTRLKDVDSTTQETS